jgi:hypothetical protein
VIFGIFKKRMQRENAKLVCQNYHAITYISGYYNKGNDAEFIEEMKNILQNWKYGDRLNSIQTAKMFEINKRYRLMYRNSIGGRLNPFDEEFKPLLGWKDFYSRVGL